MVVYVCELVVVLEGGRGAGCVTVLGDATARVFVPDSVAMVTAVSHLKLRFRPRSPSLPN